MTLFHVPGSPMCSRHPLHRTPCAMCVTVRATVPDEEYEPHPFNSRTPYEPGDDRDIWCSDCEYHRDHPIHAK